MLVLTLFLLAVCGAFAWDQYAPATLQEVIALHKGLADNKRLINTVEEKYRITVTYLGERRPIAPATRALIGDWVKTVGQDERLVSWFKQEIHVLEGEQTYWLPIQEVLWPHMGKELLAGNTVELYVLWIGYTGSDWVFLVNEFQKVSVHQLSGQPRSESAAQPIAPSPGKALSSQYESVDSSPVTMAIPITMSTIPVAICSG
jgi:hypothetical protein